MKITISSRDQVPFEGCHLRCMGHHTEHDQIIADLADLAPFYHSSCLKDILGSVELRDW